MYNTDKIAVYFIIAMASFQCWYASVLPIRGDEAYLFLKSSGLSWFSNGYPGVSALGVYIASGFGSDPFILRLPSVIMMSFAAFFVFKSAYILSGRIGGWVAMMAFVLTPAVSLAYVSVNAAPAFIFFSSVAFYFWIQAFETGRTNYFVSSGLASGAVFLCHVYGLFPFVFAIVYALLFNRGFLRSKHFLYSFVAFIICPAALAIAYFVGIKIIPGSLPFVFGESPEILLLLAFAGVPIVLYSFVRAVLGGFRTEEFNFLNISLICGIILVTVLNFIEGLDMRLVPAFFIPAFILAGAYFTKVGDKIFLGAVLLLSAVLSVYPKIAQYRGFYLPSGIKASAVYQAIGSPLSKVLENSGAVFAETMPGASLYAYYTDIDPRSLSGDGMAAIITGGGQSSGKIKRAEACVVGNCSKNFGAFVSLAKGPHALEFFSEKDSYGIFRLNVPQEETKTFYIYSVKN